MSKIDLILQGMYSDYTLEIAKSYLDLYFVNKIIISCWENDYVPDINNDRIIVIKSQDIDNPGIGNRNRQIKTSLQGLQISSTEFSVKLRSDQKISLDSMTLMYNFYTKYQQRELSFIDNNCKPYNRICVAGIFKPFPFHPRDHIFWGNTQDLIDVFNIPFDTNNSQHVDYNKHVRAETYLGAHYCANFDLDIINYINEPTKFLVDNASNIQESLAKSNVLTPKVFKPFPKIDLVWPKYGLKNYHYDLTSSQFGEYWDDNE